jgi:hypothetical protein
MKLIRDQHYGHRQFGSAVAWRQERQLGGKTISSAVRHKARKPRWAAARIAAGFWRGEISSSSSAWRLRNSKLVSLSLKDMSRT